ncbi:MAG: MATE family efflux transporter [Candidatus Omnitrophica bacterium]|nr:MATE family efflux transporter [Candidatus Omnitrophota bacterium]
MSQKPNLTVEPVGRKLTLLTIPMLFGMFSMVTFNIVDTFFVGRLGTKELAAMGFTFPVVFLIGVIALGLGTATSSVISRAIGQGDHKEVKRLTTDSLSLACLIVFLCALAGLATMTPVFKLLGASSEIIPLIKNYMTIWYVGVVFLIVPMVGNNAIRASGDTLSPGIIMTLASVINAVLDPLLIFGLAGFPRLELKGAALATVIARAMTLVISLLILSRKKKMLDFCLPPIQTLLDSWKKILYIGMPTALSNILFPLAMGAITRLVSQFGPAAVAAVGAAIRIETFTLMIIMALSSAVIPFVGQNWGAKEFERVKLAQQYTSRFSLWWGIISVLIFIIAAVPIGRLFSKDAEVISYIIRYLWIVPLGHGLRGIAMLTGSVFNAINKPLHSALLNLVRTFILYVPFAYLGAHLLGLNGIFIGITLANIITGAVAFLWINRTLESNVKLYA